MYVSIWGLYTLYAIQCPSATYLTRFPMGHDSNSKLLNGWGKWDKLGYGVSWGYGPTTGWGAWVEGNQLELL